MVEHLARTSSNQDKEYSISNLEKKFLLIVTSKIYQSSAKRLFLPYLIRVMSFVTKHVTSICRNSFSSMQRASCPEGGTGKLGPDTECPLVTLAVLPEGGVGVALNRCLSEEVLIFC